MNSKHTSIRTFGQRSIASTFLSRSSNPLKDCKEELQNEASSKNGSRVSLADFLDRKLNRACAVPRTVQGKSRPFSSPLGSGDSIGSIDGHIGAKKEGEGEASGVIDKAFFEQFKHTSADKGDCIGSCSVDEVGSSNIDAVQESRKRRNPFEGGDAKRSARKHLLVIGGDPKPKRRGRDEKFVRNKKPRPLYNHYANGSGWWDYNMEGVDNEEVGNSEVWEGVGSTTLGGLEWH